MNTNPKETIVKQASLSILLATFVATNLTAAETPFRFAGTVVDETLKPLAGAKVAVIGADRAATTDAGGKFEVAGAMADATTPCLEITATGHEQTTFRPQAATVTGLLVQEEGDNLWLSRFSLREWYEQGKKISVTNSPTFFGPVDYEIVSDIDKSKINATVKMPARNPPNEVRLSLRHSKAAPIKSVTVNGKDWKDFNKEKEYIVLKGLTGTVTVSAQY